MSEEATGQVSQSKQPAPPAERPGSGLVVNPLYAADYSGMATEPFSEEARKILAECPDPDSVEVKPDGICYMPGVWYRRQLTRAFGAGAWALRPTGPCRTVGNNVEWPGALFILGRFVAEAVGGQAVSDWMSHADQIQGAKTDCLSKCCAHGLAMASELWDKTWRESWMEKYTNKKWVEPKNGGKGKWVHSLKEKREAREANLMGVSPVPSAATHAAAPSSSGASTRDAADTSAPAPAETASPDDGTAADPADYEAIRALMKEKKFNKAGALHFLKGHFEQEQITALTKRQAVAAKALLEVWGKRDEYPAMLEFYKKSGAITANAGPVNG